MGRTAVRRVNEWDGPSMLKVYSPYTGTHMAPEQEPPGLQEYVQRIDRYTYGLGWLLCEVDHQTVGFCHLSEDPSQPEDLFSVEFQLYVKQGLSRRRIGTALWQLMREMMDMGNRRRVLHGHGVCAPGRGPSGRAGESLAGVSAGSLGPPGRKAHQAVLGGGGRLRSRQGAGGRLGGSHRDLNGGNRWQMPPVFCCLEMGSPWAVVRKKFEKTLTNF